MPDYASELPHSSQNRATAPLKPSGPPTGGKGCLTPLFRDFISQSPETHNGGSCSTSNPRGLKLAQVSPDFDGFSVNLCASVVRWAIIRCLLFDGPGLWKACGQHQHAPGSAVSEDAADLTLKCGGTAAELCAKFAGKRSQTSVVCRREKL